MKKLKFILLVLTLFTFTNIVNAKETYISKKGIYCGNTEVIFNGIIKKTNKILVVDKNNTNNQYIWQEDNTCTTLTNEDYLDYYNEPTSYIYNHSNEVEITNYNFSYEIAYLLNTKPYDESTTYYLYNSTDEIMEVQDVNANTPNLNTYYILKYLKHLDTPELDNNTTYYEYSNSLEYNINIYEEVNNPVSSEILSYYIETTYSNILKDYTKYTYNETIYNRISANANQVSIEVYDGKMYALVYEIDYQTGDITSTTYYDEFGNEITEYKDLYVIFTDNYKIMYSRNESTINIYNKSTNELINTITLDEDNILFSFILEEYNNNLYLLETNKYNYSNLKTIYLKQYQVLEGDNQTYNNEDLTIKINGHYNLFSKVLINDVKLNTNNYQVTEGSTIITLKKDYLNTLSSGKYQITAVYTDGANISTTFTINEENPKTFDSIYTYIIISIISLTALLTCIINKKKIFN